MEAGPRTVDLDAYSGIFVGGGPFNASDPIEKKSSAQPRRGGDRRPSRRGGGARLPFFGACYGVGTRRTSGRCHRRHLPGAHQRHRGRQDGAGRDDPLLAGLPDRFAAFVGHKEAISTLPATATLLVRGEACPVQMFRVGRNVYATQFHPECDVEGISTRIRAYAGYFGADELDLTLAAVRRRPVCTRAPRSSNATPLPS
jgi:GMP synthase (glutamine-hydrolysing)